MMIVAQLMMAEIVAIDMMYMNACSGSSPTTTTAMAVTALETSTPTHGEPALLTLPRTLGASPWWARACSIRPLA